jgi:hypothetical protein
LFEILTAVITQALSKILGTSVDIVAKDVSWKRSMAAACIDLYDSLTELENSSRTAYTIFKAIAERTRTPTKTKIKDVMEPLFASFVAFDKSLRKVESKLGIYDRALLFKIRDVRSLKFGILDTLDMLLDAAPVQLKDSDKLTSLIEYPTVVPRSDDSLGALQSTPSSVEQEVKRIKAHVMAQFKKTTVDLNLPAEAAIAIRTAEDNLRSIEQTRQQLAEFIKESFPLKEILT